MPEKKIYTVTAFTTNFVEAEDYNEAISVVYEALLGNDKNNILGNSEVHITTMIAREGYHSSIRDEEYK